MCSCCSAREALSALETHISEVPSHRLSDGLFELFANESIVKHTGCDLVDVHRRCIAIFGGRAVLEEYRSC